MAKKSDSVWGEVVTTPVGRLAYNYLAEKDTGNKYSSGKYSVRILLKKDELEGDDRWDDFYAQLEDVAEKAGVEVDDLPDALHDGDGKNSKKKPYPDSHEGCVFFNAKTDRRPDIYMLNEEGEAEPIEDTDVIKEQVYAGCYGALMVQPFLQDLEGSLGYILVGVIKLEDGERLGDGTNVDTQALANNWAGKLVGKSKKSSTSTKKKSKTSLLKTKKEEAPEEVEEDGEVEEEAPVKKKSTTRKKKSNKASIANILGGKQKSNE